MKPLNIGVAGGIGAGKSAILRRLKLEYPDSNIFSVDDEVRKLYIDPDWREYLIQNYGTADKRKISAMAFEDPTMLKDIMEQSSVHINGAIARWMKNPGINIIEFPLLFEYEYDKTFDFTILITAHLEERIQRVMRRDSKTREEVERIISTQLTDDQKIPRADFIIDTTLRRPDSEDYDLAMSNIIGVIQSSKENQQWNRPLCFRT